MGAPDSEAGKRVISDCLYSIISYPLGKWAGILIICKKARDYDLSPRNGRGLSRMRLAIEGRRAENQGGERRGVVGQCRQGIDEQAQLWEIGKRRWILWVLGRGGSMGGTSEEAGSFPEEVMGGTV